MTKARADSRQILDLSEVINGQKRNLFVIRLLALSTLITFFDGYDLNGISFAAPAIMREYGIDRAAFGSVFGIGLFGFMLGGFIFGWLGDRIGRRPTIVLAAAAFGVLTFVTSFASSVGEFTVLRFVGGLAIGGLVPVTWALNIEFAPPRYRATVVTIIMLGYAVGSSLGGVISAWLIPLYSWRVVFWVGGLLPVLVSALLYLGLPESIRFLAVKGRRPEEIARTVRLLRPDIAASADMRFVVGDEHAGQGSARGFRLADLFVGRLRVITPLLWIAYIGSSMAVFFLSSWMPTLAEASGLDRASAALGASLLSLGGAVGALLLMRFVDRFGAIAVTMMPLVACPLVAMLGMFHFDGAGFMQYMAVVGMFVIGGHTGLHSIAGLFYPSAIRSNGAGWAISVAKVGSIAGPWIGGLLLGAKFDLAHIFLFASLPLVMFVVCIFPLGLQHLRLRADDARAAAPAGLGQET